MRRPPETILPAPATPTKHTVRIYIDNGVCYEYDVHGAHKAREHSAAIVQGGYRHNDGAGEFEHFPPHRVLKVKITGVIPTLYPDRVSGT